MSKLAVFLC